MTDASSWTLSDKSSRSRWGIPHWTGTSDRSPIRYKTVTVDQDETHVFVVRAT
jgi:hypothetical protein